MTSLKLGGKPPNFILNNNRITKERTNNGKQNCISIYLYLLG